MNVSLKKFALLPLVLMLALSALAYLPSTAYADDVSSTTKLYDGNNNEITSAVTVEKGDSYTFVSKTTYTYYDQNVKRNRTATDNSSVFYYSDSSCTEGQTSTQPTKVGTYYVRGEFSGTKPSFSYDNVQASQSPVITLTITEHTHTYGDPEYTWSADNRSATASMTCTKCGDKVTEQVNTLFVIYRQADCTNPQITNYTAWFKNSAFTIQYKEVETAPALGHSVVHHDFLPSTCTEDGNKEYWSCSRCNKYFSDEACTTETTADDVKLSAKGHTPYSGTVTKEPTCTEVGQKTYTCIICRSVAKTEEIPALGHKLVSHARVEPTATEDGYEEYWECSVCKLMFSDAEGENAISNPIVIPATGSADKGDGSKADGDKGGTSTTTTVTKTTTTTKAKAAAGDNATPKTGDTADFAVVLFSVLATLALVSGRVAYKRR